MFTDNNGNKWYKVGLHIHTTLSDGRVTPETSAKIYKDNGFDLIAMTDHWKYHGEDSISGLKIISGCEYNFGTHNSLSGVMHIVGVGMDYDPNLSREDSRQTVIDKINESGGIAILAHPAWSLNTVDDVTELTGFTATEIYNTVSDVNQSHRPYSGYFVDIAANKGIVYKLVATDDAHYYDGNDEAKSYIMVNAASDSKEDILTAIRKGDFFATQGPWLSVKKDGEVIKVECSECVKIAFVSNSVFERDKILRADALTSGEYKVKDYEKWVRVEVSDKNGLCAWSNVFVLD